MSEKSEREKAGDFLRDAHLWCNAPLCECGGTNAECCEDAVTALAALRAADRAAVAKACAEIVTRMERPVLHGDGFTSVSGSAEAIRALAAKLARGEGHE